MLGIAWCLAPLEGGYAGGGWWIMLVATAVTLLTGFDYLVKALRVHRGAHPPTGQIPAQIAQNPMTNQHPVSSRLGAEDRCGAGEEATA
jgi:hypothetical protein